MASRSHPIVIFLDRNGFLLYQDFLANVWQFPFSEDLVRHLEIINKDQLVNNILSFVKTNKLMPTSLIVILSESVIFQKDLTPIQQGQGIEAREAQEKEIQQFLENVPFEYSLAKVVGQVRIVATNKELLETIILPFRKIGCIVDAVVPSFVYDGKIDFSMGLTPDVAKAILHNPDLLKMGNMLVGQKEAEVEKEPSEEKEHTDSSKEKSKNTRQIVLAVIFVFLLVVLTVVYFVTKGDSGTSKRTQNSFSTSLPTPTPTSTLSPTIALESTVEDLSSPSAITPSKGTKTTIVVNEETQDFGNVLKRLLEQLGLQDITVSVAQTQNPARSAILFSKDIENETRRIVTDEVKKILPDVSVAESESLGDLRISIAVGSAL